MCPYSLICLFTWWPVWDTNHSNPLVFQLINIGSHYQYGSDDHAEFLCVVSREYPDNTNSTDKVTEPTDRAKVSHNQWMLSAVCSVSIMSNGLMGVSLSPSALSVRDKDTRVLCFTDTYINYAEASSSECLIWTESVRMSSLIKPTLWSRNNWLDLIESLKKLFDKTKSNPSPYFKPSLALNPEIPKSQIPKCWCPFLNSGLWL